MFIKLGELNEISKIENTESSILSINKEILESFKKTASELKKIAPRAEDFLYFSAVMLHAAEAAALNEDGTTKLNKKGQPVEVSWDTSGGTWRWKTNDPSIKPYKNANCDIFPEIELIKAHKKWVGKPLCIDHKSNSVDHTRGFIVDTYYDRNLKRVVGLCALDKANYPDLAKKVSSLMQTSVSMGTAVGKAICTDCATVAQTERDFCNHMKMKSGYGEINTDLNPIELSIVVNGADPKAHIKHIIASVNTLNSYIDSKQEELNKIADNYVAHISLVKGESPNESSVGEKPGSETNIKVMSKDIESFRKDIDKAISDFEELQTSLNEENMQESANETVSDQDAEDSTTGMAPPHARFASVNVGVDPIAELKEVVSTIETKLGQLTQSLNKLANASTNKQEENMSGSNFNKTSYFQGAGGVNEPTPGQVKYPKDPLNEHLREKEDRQMVGQSPFPGVGPVDGMHPSPDSVDQSNELDRKKMLARAEYEERAQRRQGIVNMAKAALENKQAYFHGGGGVNEPTPGKVKYPADKMNETVREKEDKQMVGQKPFPGVGSVDGLHPSPSSVDVSDELKRKEMLSRASRLSAKFAYATNQDGSRNIKDSAWEIYRGDKLILAASVNDLSKGNASRQFSSIATKEYGTKLLEQVKAHGVDKVRAFVKNAQEQLDMAAPAAPATPEMPVANEMPEAPVQDTGKSGDVKESATEMAEKARDLTSDLVETVRALEGEQAEMGSVENDNALPEMGVAASFNSKTLNTFRRELNGLLTSAMRESIADLQNHAQELDTISSLENKNFAGQDQNLLATVKEDAVNEAKNAIADGFKLMTAFVKYARGTKEIIKKAQVEAELGALSEGENMNYDGNNGDDLMSMISDTNSELDDVKQLMESDEPMVEEDESMVEEVPVEELSSDDNDIKAGDLKPETDLKPEMLNQASFDSKRGRAALRAKLAADALGKQDNGELQDMSHAKFSDMLNQSNSLADGQTELDVKPSDNLGRVETLTEANKQMMDLAKASPKVRKEAEAIHKLISEGSLNVSDLDELVAEGLDKDAVAYYKKYWSQVDGGSEFASELAKEHVKASLEKELNTYRVKLARAYELAYEMVDVGLCSKAGLNTQVNEIMEYNDTAFDHLKRIVAQHTPILQKMAKLPQVGVIGSGEMNAASSAQDDWSQLSAAFAKTTKRMF